MPKFKNVSPLGALDVPALGRVVEPEEVFEVRDDIAEAIAAQASNYEPVDAKAKKIAAKIAAPAEGADTEGDADGDAA
ncbi:hypothetical protein [Microbacterium allomyrinae]|uniref:Uncharacterized protein n=1 Tax=Microbacterium allomyrinae TaxID=2830666 RepID=A0A9X1LRM5_9MICO|nr:hypothetical protein [Microbacterium allomyrinae]MCC2030616.1 hypothetical protein [Microbacterium allomyrinae]